MGVAAPTARPSGSRGPSTPSGEKKGDTAGWPLFVTNWPSASTSGSPSPSWSTKGAGTAPFTSGTAAYARGSRCTTYWVGESPTSYAVPVCSMICRVSSRVERGRERSAREPICGSAEVLRSGRGLGVAAVRISSRPTASSCCICAAAAPGMGLRLPMPSGLDGSMAPAGLYGSESVATSESSDCTMGTSAGYDRTGCAAPIAISSGRYPWRASKRASASCVSVAAFTSFMTRPSASVKRGTVPSSSSVTMRPTTSASSWCNGPIPPAAHDLEGSAFVTSFSGMVCRGNAASKAAMVSSRSCASASMRATRYARSVFWRATGTGLPSTSTAWGSNGGSRDWSTVEAKLPLASG